MTGSKTWTTSFRITSSMSKLAEAVFISSPIHSGVMNTPSRLDRLALKIAAEILPPANDTITTADDTVPGSAARKKIPSQIVCKSEP